MKQLRQVSFVEHGHDWLLLLRFGLVGGSGVLVNLAVAVFCNRVGPFLENPLLLIPLTEFNVRWYHLYFLVSFLAANLWNFQLNRYWAFRRATPAKWWKEFWAFLAVGLVSAGAGLLIMTSLMNPASPVSLPRTVFDGSSGLRNPSYWSQLLAVIVTLPASFAVNKLWTFRSVGGTATGRTVAE